MEDLNMAELREIIPRWGGVSHAGIATFLRAPILEEVSTEELRARKVKAAVFGVPFDAASISRPGSSLGPRAIRNSTSGSGPYHFHYDVDIVKELNLHDCGDSFIALGDAKKTMENGADVASEILKAGALPIILGGEHTVTLAGTLAVDRVLKGKYGFIHLDAHLDAEKEAIQYFHGSQVARTSELEAFPCENMVLIGQRGTSNPKSHFQFVKDNGITCFTMYQVVDIGFANVIDQALAIATRGTDGFYLSIDMDVLEAAHVPGAQAFQCFGITTRELWSVLPKFGFNDKLVAFDVVEVVPAYDRSEMTAMTAKSICIELLAARATIVDKIKPPPVKRGGQ